MASIKKRGQKYIVRWLDSAKKQHTRTAPDMRTAKALKLEIETSASLGRDWVPQSTRNDIDIETIASEYITHRSTRIRPGTLNVYAGCLDTFVRFLRTIRPRGPLLASMLTRAALEMFHDWLSANPSNLTGRPRSVDTNRKTVEVVQLMWSWADDSERWPDRIPRPRRIEMTHGPKKPVVAPTWAEMASVVICCAGRHRRLAVLLYYTGFRCGETMLMKWSDVDLIRRTIAIRPEINKTNTGRVVPISAHLASELAGWSVDGDFLIPSNNKTRKAKSAGLEAAWVKAGVPESIWGGSPHHAFRRGFKSGLLSLGAPPDAVDYLQGHTLGEGRARGRYIDPMVAFDLPGVVAMIPPLPPPT